MRLAGVRPQPSTPSIVMPNASWITDSTKEAASPHFSPNTMETMAHGSMESSVTEPPKGIFKIFTRLSTAPSATIMAHTVSLYVLLFFFISIIPSKCDIKGVRRLCRQKTRTVIRCAQKIQRPYFPTSALSESGCRFRRLRHSQPTYMSAPFCIFIIRRAARIVKQKLRISACFLALSAAGC